MLFLTEWLTLGSKTIYGPKEVASEYIHIDICAE